MGLDLLVELLASPTLAGFALILKPLLVDRVTQTLGVAGVRELLGGQSDAGHRLVGLVLRGLVEDVVLALTVLEDIAELLVVLIPSDDASEVIAAEEVEGLALLGLLVDLPIEGLVEVVVEGVPRAALVSTSQPLDTLLVPRRRSRVAQLGPVTGRSSAGST